MPQSKKSTSGMGSIRKVTKVVKGKEYTYYEARYTEGFDPKTGFYKLQKADKIKTAKKVKFKKAKSK